MQKCLHHLLIPLKVSRESLLKQLRGIRKTVSGFLVRAETVGVAVVRQVPQPQLFLCYTHSMKAIIVDTYGPPSVAHVADVPKPRIKKPNEVLVRVVASSVNSGDARIRRADPWMVRLMYGLTGPRRKILGMTFAGVVEDVGAAVRCFSVGDRVYGMNEKGMGCHAAYVVVPDSIAMVHMPAAMPYTDAAALPFGGTTALHFLEGIELAGKTVLINGASGTVGLAFLQLARGRGARVIAVSSAANLSLLEMLGAVETIDYMATDVPRLSKEFDVVIDCVNVIPLNRIEALVQPGGHLILLAGLVPEMLQSWRLKKASVRIGPAAVTTAQIATLSQLYTAGTFKPVVARSFRLDEIVAAYELVDSGHKVGTVVLEVGD